MPPTVCPLCLDGIPIGTVPPGSCEGEPACSDCLRALSELGHTHAIAADYLGDDDGYREAQWEARGGL